MLQKLLQSSLCQPHPVRGIRREHPRGPAIEVVLKAQEFLRKGVEDLQPANRRLSIDVVLLALVAVGLIVWGVLQFQIRNTGLGIVGIGLSLGAGGGAWSLYSRNRYPLIAGAIVAAAAVVFVFVPL